MSDVKSADKKAQIYTDPNTGKKRIRMVATDKKVVDKDVERKISVSEVSNDTLRSYGAKAKSSAIQARRSALAATARGDKKDFNKNVNTLNKRSKGLKSLDKRLPHHPNESIKDQEVPVDEISIKDLTKKVSNSTGLKNVNKAMNKDKLKDDLAKMKAKLATTESVSESVDTNRVKQLGTLGLVDKKDVQRLMTIMKKLDDDKDLNIREKDMVVDMFQQLISVVTGDVSTFSKTKKAVSEDVEELDEISKEKAADYHAKSVQFQKNALRSNDPKKLKKIGNRLIGVSKANKITAKK